MIPVHEKILICLVKQNDRSAAEKLIKANYKQVYSIILSFCKHKQTAEDLTQETFIKIWQNIKGFNGKSRFSTWSYKIAYNTFLDWQRKQTLLYDDQILEKFSDSYIEYNDNLHDMEFVLLIEQINQLPQKLKAAIILHYQNELSISEISKILEIPKGTVKSRLNAGLEQLRQNKNVQELK